MANKNDASNTNNANKSGNDDQKDALALITQNMNQLTNLVKGLTDGFTTMQGSINALAENSNKASQKNDDPPVDLDSIDVERMDQKDLIKLTLKLVGQQFSSQFNELKSGLSGASLEARKASLKTELTNVAEKNPDFFHWADSIKERLKSNPGLSVQDALVLARASDPEKYKQIQEDLEAEAAKAKAAEDKSGNDNRDDKGGKGGKPLSSSQNKEGTRVSKSGNDGDKDKRGFGGMPPSGDGGEDTTSSTKMSKEDAVEDAWGAAIANHPEAAEILNNFSGDDG